MTRPAPTPEEAAEEAAYQETSRRHRAVAPVVTEARKGHRGRTVQRDCPLCGVANALVIAIAASNGHARVACRSGCVSFME